MEISLWSERIKLNGGFELYQEYIGSSMQSANADSGFSFETQARGSHLRHVDNQSGSELASVEFPRITSGVGQNASGTDLVVLS